MDFAEQHILKIKDENPGDKVSGAADSRFLHHLFDATIWMRSPHDIIVPYARSTNLTLLFDPDAFVCRDKANKD